MRPLRRLAGRLLRHYGWERRRESQTSTPTPAQLVKRLQRFGLKGQHIIDIGGHKGDYARSLLKVLPDAFCTVFEPQTELHQFMGDLKASRRVEIVAKGVGASTGRFEFTRHERADSQSFAIGSDRAAENGWARDVLEVTSLDDYMQTCPWPAPDIIKIDAEGWDIEVARGAPKTLATAELVFMEASVIRSAGPYLPEVLHFMDQAGYMFLTFTDLAFNYQQFHWFIEAAMIRRDGVVNRSIPRALTDPAAASPT